MVLLGDYGQFMRLNKDRRTIKVVIGKGFETVIFRAVSYNTLAKIHIYTVFFLCCC
jgi:hypothetical protein